VLLPVKLHRGAKRFEMIRTQTDPVSLCYSPRLAQWAEDGPVYLHAWHIALADSSLHPPSRPASTPETPTSS
jgi:hypothetical protein